MIGRHSSTLETPALCVDLDILEQNAARIRDRLIASGKRSRCDAGGLLSGQLIRYLAPLGLNGVALPSLSMAEVLAEAGGTDLVITRPIVGPDKLERYARLARRIRLVATVDHYVHAEQIDSICHREGLRAELLVEVNLGRHHLGVRPGPDTQHLLRGIRRLSNVEVIGLTGDAGHLETVTPATERDRLVRSAMGILGETRDRMVKDGMRCDVVSIAGLAVRGEVARCPEPTEVRVGGGVFGDPHRPAEELSLLPALSLIGTVLHRGKLERAVLDCGAAAFSLLERRPIVRRIAGGHELPDSAIDAVDSDTCRLALGLESYDLRIGDKVELVLPPEAIRHSAHRVLHAVRSGMVVDVWPLDLRCL